MNICVSSKDYFKENQDAQRAIICGVKDLYARIHKYEEQNVTFDRIFNDDKVKYDKHGQLFTYKFQKSNMQIRILYAYLIIEGVPVVLIADFFIKKRTSKNYIAKFDSMNKVDPLDLYAKSKVIYSI